MFLCWQKIKVLLKPSGEGEAGDLEIVCIEQVSAAEKTERAGMLVMSPPELIGCVELM